MWMQQEVQELQAQVRDLMLHLEKVEASGVSAEELAQSHMLVGEPEQAAGRGRRRKKHKWYTHHPPPSARASALASEPNDPSALHLLVCIMCASLPLSIHRTSHTVRPSSVHSRSQLSTVNECSLLVNSERVLALRSVSLSLQLQAILACFSFLSKHSLIVFLFFCFWFLLYQLILNLQ